MNALDISRCSGGAASNVSMSAVSTVPRDLDERVGHLFGAYFRPVSDPGWGITSHSTGSIDTTSDHSYLIRQAFVDVPFFAGADQGIFATSLNNPAGGITTGASTFTGVIATKSAYERALATGKAEAWFDMARGAIQTTAGTVFLGYRGVSMATTATGVDASSPAAATVLGKATYWLGFVGSVLFGLLYASFIPVAIANLRSISELEREMGDDPVTYLTSYLDINEGTIHRDFQGRDADWEDELIREAADVAEEELGKLGIEYNDFRFQAMASRQQRINLGKIVKMAKLRAEREGHLTNLIGSINVERIKNKDIKLDQISSALDINKKVWQGILAVCVVGTICSVLSLVFTGGIGALIANAVILFSCVGMYAIDAYCFKATLESSSVPGRHDAKAAFGHMLITGITFAIGAALTVAFSLPFPPLIILALIAVGVMALDAYAIVKINEKRHRALLEKPTWLLVREMLEAKQVAEEDVACIGDALNIHVKDLAQLGVEVEAHFQVIEIENETAIRRLQQVFG